MNYTKCNQRLLFALLPYMTMTLQAAGRVCNAEPFQKKIKTQQEDPYSYILKVINKNKTWKKIGYTKPVIPEIDFIAKRKPKVKKIKKLIQQLKTHEEMEKRIEVVRELGQLAAYEEETIPVLIELLTKKMHCDLRIEITKTLSKLLAAEAITTFVYFLQYDKDSKVRYYAVEGLANLRIKLNPKIISVLMSSLKNDKNSEVRSKVATILGRQGNEKLIPLLKKALQEEKVPIVRVAIIGALGQLLGTQSKSFLISIVKQKKGDDEIIFKTLELLGELEGEEIDTLLIDIAIEGSAGTLREKVLQILKKRDCHEKAVSSFIKTMETSEWYYKCSRAVEALGELGKGRTEGYKAVMPLIKQLKDKNKNIREDVVEALGKIRDPRAVQGLIYTLYSDSDLDVSAQAAKALGNIGDQRAILPLISVLDKRTTIKLIKNEKRKLELELLKNDLQEMYLMNGYYQYEYYCEKNNNNYYCDSSMEKRRLSLLQKHKDFLNNPQTKLESYSKDLAINAYFVVRKEAIEALGKIGGEKALVALSNALNFMSYDIEDNLKCALGSLGDDGVMDFLVRMLQSEFYSFEEHLMAVEALGNLGIKGKEGKNKIEEALLTSLNNNEELRVRMCAATALGKLQCCRAVPMFIRILKKEGNYDWVHDCLLDALNPIIGCKYGKTFRISLTKYDGPFRGEFIDYAFRSILIKAVADVEDPEHRNRLVCTLGYMECEEAIYCLSDALEDEDKEVRKSAVWALGQTKRKEVIPTLVYVVKNDKDEKVRNSAIAALAMFGVITAKELTYYLLLKRGNK